MHENARYLRKQALFLRALLSGQTVGASAKMAGISERTAYYWLADPVFAEKKQRLFSELAQAEQAEIIRLSLEEIRAMAKRGKKQPTLTK